MGFQLNKPPVAEVWIQSSYAPAADGEGWDWHDAHEFLGSFGELPIREILPRMIPVVSDVDAADVLDEIQVRAVPRFLRARTESRSKIVQVGENELLVSHVRNSEVDYPGFTPLKALFLDAHRRYTDTFTPERLKIIELHYVDIIALAVTEGQEVELSDYFEGAPDLPSKPFGNAFDVSWSFGFNTGKIGDLGQMAVRTLPPEPGFLRFRLDWHRTCKGFDESDAGVANRLIEAHNYLKECFRSVCKDPIWRSFEPQE